MTKSDKAIAEAQRLLDQATNLRAKSNSDNKAAQKLQSESASVTIAPMRKANVKGRRTLPYSAKASVKNSTTSPEAVKLAERRAQACEYRRRGHSYAEIATAMKCSTSTAFEYVVAAIKELHTEPAHLVVVQEVERCDQLMKTHYPKALKGDYDATILCLRVMDQRARYLGLYAPTKIANTVSSPAGGPIEMDHVFEIRLVKPTAPDHAPGNGKLIEHTPNGGNGHS